MAYEINYDDERFTQVESDKDKALGELDATYDKMISDSDKYYQDQIQASKDWADKQSQLQQEKTDFAIEKVEQQKEQTKKDYLKEQSGAYVDWQKQSNQYGANAEAMAAQGMQNTGFSESSQVSMYNTYQNRVATAREAYNQAVLNYNNAITEARLQNNSILAEIAAEALQQQLELALQQFQHKNTLIQAKADKKTQLESEYYARYQDVLKQINTENALAEEVRQFNESMAFEREQYEYAKAQAAKKSSSNTRNSSNDSGDDVKASIEKSKSTAVDTAAKKQNQSILSLGYGPISGAKLMSLVEQGKVEEYKDKSGTTMFRKTSNQSVKSSKSSLYGRLGKKD